MFPAPSRASWKGKSVTTPPELMTVPVLGDRAATGASPNPYSGSVNIGFCEPSYNTTAPVRRPGAVGRKLISTEQLALVPVLLLQVVSTPAVKSRFCTPEVKTFTEPNGVDPMVKGSVSVTAVEEPSWMWPNPTTDLLREYVGFSEVRL